MSQQPIHQVVLNGSISDVGSAASSIEVNDSDNRITYVNNDGKDSIFINSDGYSPKINIPFAINTGSFTYGVWIKLVSYDAWCMPISINSGASISLCFGLSRELLANGGASVVSSYSYYGDGTVNYANWNHIGITYSNGLITFYLNGNSRLTISGSVSTSAQITIGGNAQYQSNFGGQQTWSGYLHQLCIFDYALSSAEMTNLAAQTQGNDILGPPPNPLIPRDLVVSVTTTSFTVSWTAEGATSYTFTVNDSPVTPSTQEGNSATFTDLTSNTVYALVITAINDTESESSNPTSITTMPDPPGSINVSTSLIKSSSFVASWTGGERATSYTYTLNGTAATPSINNALTDKTVKFTGLTPTTAYTLVVKAINISGEAVSTATLTTLDPPPLEPVHQVVFSDSADDLGTSVIEVGTGDVIEYANYYGKDSVYINSDGTNPRIYTPCVFTDATPFTFAFWINFENVGAWCIPISMNGPNIYIALGFNIDSMYLSIGNGEGGLYNQYNFLAGADFRTWNHITVTYTAGTFTIYKNGIIGGSLSIQSGFTTSQITIGGNVQYQLHLGGQATWAGYLHQLCVFDSVLSTQDISQLYTQTQGNKVFITPTNPLTPYQLELTNLSYTEFTVSWLGLGESYTFTLNGDAVTPTQTSNSATFTGLTPNTPYILLITATNDTESQTSLSKTIRTLKPIPNPVHQFVFNGLTDDVGTTPSAMIVEDPASIIEYVEFEGKNCVHINSDANTPNIKIPYTVSNTSSFTISYWANIPIDNGWQIPLVLINAQKTLLFSGLTIDSLYFGAGTSYASTASSTDQSAWNHIAMTYSNGMCKFYINGYIKFKIPYTEAFTSTELSICGNSKYVVSVFGQTVCNVYIRQMCIFDAELNYGQVSDLYVKTQGNLAFSSQANTDVPYFITLSDIDYTSFKASWLGGPADGYTYTLNGIPVTPSTQLSKSVEFTGLSNGTDYSFVITVGEFSSSPLTITTKATLPAPVNQFIFNNSLEDLGTNPVTATGQGTYTTHSEKVCLDINTNGTTPLLTIPYVITNTSSFTLSFWLHNPYVHGVWSIPIGVDDGSSSILEFALVWDTTCYIIIGNQNGYTTTSAPRTDWTHLVVSYNDGIFEVYCNNDVVFREARDYTFTSTRINIGGNNNFVLWYFGEQALTSAVAKIRQLCTFDTALTEEQVNELYIQSQENVTVGVPPNPLKPYNLSLSAITKTSFKVSWQGATGATSYTYTLNGSPATPSVEGNSATFSGLIADTTYAIIITAVNDTETQASRSKSVKTLPEPPVKPIVSVSSQTYNSFTASWTGGTTATSYTYTLNGTAATPSTDNSITEKTVVFTGLSPSTAYMLVITAVNAGGQTAADPVTATTAELPPFPVAIHQLILDNSTDNVGSSGATTSLIGDIVFTNYEGKDCINCTFVENNNPSIVLPCAFTNESSFTISFWIFAYSSSDWRTPITLNNGTLSHILFSSADITNWIVVGQNDTGTSNNSTTEIMNANAWNNLTLTYQNGQYKLYINGIYTGLGLELNLNTAWESSQITIGFNNAYRTWFFGGPDNDTRHIRQVCVFDSVLTPEDISTLYTLTEGNTVLGVPPNPLKPYGLTLSSVTKTSFIVSWSGATGATSYTFTMNGTPVTPTQVNKTATFTGLTANTGYTLVITAVNDTESQASAPKSVTTLPNAPVKPIVSVTSQTYNSFTASWTGGAGAASYTYTLDGTAATPSTDNSLTEKTVVFTGLNASTSYTLVITAINAGGQTVADPVTATTAELPPFPVAIHQLILDNTDSGSQATTITVEDPYSNISYTTNAEKDCIYINSDGTNPRIIIPCVFTDATPFTFSFWVKFDNVDVWNMPVSINGSDISIGVGFYSDVAFTSISNGVNANYTQNSSGGHNFTEQWGHIVITYDAGTVLTYVNGSLGTTLTFSPEFTTSQITIGGNHQYQLLGLGGRAYWIGYVRQICVFDSALTPEDISTLYTLTEGNTVLGVPPNPLKPYSLTLSSITTTAFNVSWSGATGATSYTFTLNGSPATPTQVNKTASFTGLTPNTDYTVVITAVNDTESQSSAPKNLKTLMLPPTALSLTIGSVTFNSFVATWTGAEGAESYTYTLNGTETTPFTQTANSVTFKSLLPNTAYTLIVTAVNAGGQTASEPSSLTTLFAPPLPYPINQLVLNDSAEDVGSEPADVVTAGDIIYTNYGEKDCFSIYHVDNGNPSIRVPCVFTESTPFTISYWQFNVTNPNYWYCPVSLHNANSSIANICNLSTDLMILFLNLEGNDIPYQITLGQWNHFTITYEDGTYSVYINGVFLASRTNTTPFTSTGLTIGDTYLYSGGTLSPNYTNMYVRQACIFDSALIAEQVSTLYTETQDNTVIAPPATPLTPYRVSISSIATTSFNVSWSGGVDALSYSYTLNGTPATPFSQTSNSARFTGLSAGTSYTIVITAIGASDSKASSPKNLKTFSMPIRQLILSDSSEDLGTSTLAAESGDIIEYTNYAGKDCVFIMSDGYNPTIKVPCVFTQTSSFTFGFWINFDNVAAWCIPITMNGTNIDITLAFDATSMHLSLGDGQNVRYTQVHIMHGSDFRTWNHLTVTYTNQTVSIYKNGSFAGSQPLTEEFTTSQITIGGNTKYQYGLGGQVNWSGYLRQLCVFDSLLSQQEISQLYTQTVGNTVIVSIANTLKPYLIDLTNLDFTEFSISWSGAIGATSYTFTLNGAAATPLYEENSVRFTDLIPNTSYTVIVTAISPTDTQSSISKTVKTRTPLTNPSHQFVFNGSSVDLGTNASYTIVRDPGSIIEYVTYEGKNCIHINSDGDKPNIKIPYVVFKHIPFYTKFLGENGR
jgi:hypothetical protein